MDFDCQSAKKISTKDILTKYLDIPPTEKVNSNQLIITSKKKFGSSKTGNQVGLSKPNGKLGIPIGETSASFADLPAALISEILNFLDPKGLGIVACVSTSLYGIASEHSVWKEFYCERWGHPVTLGPEHSNEKSWKQLFVERESRSKTFMGRYSIDKLCGHKEAVRTVFVLASKKLVFTSGYDEVVRVWDMEEGLSIGASRPLGTTIRAVVADSRVLIAGGTAGFIHGWNVEDGNPHLFDIRSQNQNLEFRFWGHEGAVTCLALDFCKMYSGSWDNTVRVWDRFSLKCLNVLVHSDWVWGLAPHDTTVVSTSGSCVHIWDSNSGKQLGVTNNAHVGTAYALARSHTGKLLFTGGDDGAIHMFETKGKLRKIATWNPHSGPVYSLAFEFPWLVSASSDGKISLIDVRKLLKTNMHYAADNTFKCNYFDQKEHVEPPQRMLHGFGPDLFSVGIGSDRIVCGGEEGIVRIWNFSEALEIEQRVQTMRGIRLENRMRRRKLQKEICSKGGQGGEQCSVAAKTDKNGWHNTRSRVSGKAKA